jgi:hypothetical protein
MQAISVNYLAVIIAAAAGFAVGFGWYGLLGKIWMEALGKKKTDMKPSPMPFIIAAVALLVMAWMLAGLMGHLNDVTVKGGVTTAFFVWIGFVLTTVGVNQAFQGLKPVATAIDVGHWLAVLLIMGAIIGAFGV